MAKHFDRSAILPEDQAALAEGAMTEGDFVVTPEADPFQGTSDPRGAYESVDVFEASEAADPEGGGQRELMPAWLDFLLTALVTIAVVLFVRAFVADTYEVPTGSMLETIQLGDRLVGEKLSYRFRAPRAGEVVTFQDPTDARITLIKRVIATEGQTVDLVDGIVFVDGVALDEPYVLGKESWPIDRFAPTLSEEISYPYVVPEGHVWVMGDNRTNSLDSRYFGAVPIDTVAARALFIFWPPADAGTL